MNPVLSGDADTLLVLMDAHRATMTHMEVVGIREMRQNLSRYAQRARHGESFLITDRGREVAQLTPAPGRASAIDRLVAERGARRGQGELLDVLEELPAPILGPPSSVVLDELRSERL
jgi:prevent-host-death family protein